MKIEKIDICQHDKCWEFGTLLYVSCQKVSVWIAIRTLNTSFHFDLTELIHLLLIAYFPIRHDKIELALGWIWPYRDYPTIEALYSEARR